MAKFQSMHKYFVAFLALFLVFNDTHLTHGRKILKPLNTSTENNNNPHHPPSPDNNNNTPSSNKVENGVVAMSTTTLDHGDGRKTLAGVKISVNGAGPGHSPGAGHKKFGEEDHHDNRKSSMEEGKEVSVNGVGPGPSPGAGHSKTDGTTLKIPSMGAAVVSHDNEDVKDSIEGVGPGHSPGVGHKN
ncbi:hypothetical protein PIB30_080807 [Stylosanthes scabra]|uniref:Uncharacterized protein n=1 Tax=Stylosanthes scabra TaxID=79078 RepID=A0ABU6TRW3_9FABA|nr:hypothetical protein [Stylosanthes scabra]